MLDFVVVAILVSIYALSVVCCLLLFQVLATLMATWLVLDNDRVAGTSHPPRRDLRNPLKNLYRASTFA